MPREGGNCLLLIFTNRTARFTGGCGGLLDNIFKLYIKCGVLSGFGREIAIINHMKENNTGTYKYDPKTGKVVRVSAEVPSRAKKGHTGPCGGCCGCCHEH